MAYSNDTNLVAIRPDILNFGVESWPEKHDEAALIINRAIDSQWYRSVALDNNVDYRDVPFDESFVTVSQLLRLSCYKTLELIYLSLQKNTSEDDGFERQRKVFAKLYDDEFTDVVGAGLDYDWDGSGVLAAEEKTQQMKRRLRKA